MANPDCRNLLDWAFFIVHLGLPGTASGKKFHSNLNHPAGKCPALRRHSTSGRIWFGKRYHCQSTKRKIPLFPLRGVG